MALSSTRCTYREFGSSANGQTFADKHPELAQMIKDNDVADLMSPEFSETQKLSSLIRKMPEYSAFLKTTMRSDFFFAAFDQSSAVEGHKIVKKTGPKDMEKFIIERLKNQLEVPRKNHEFVIEAEGAIVGYVELFDTKRVEGKMQCERGVFINPEYQSAGFGKEAVIAVTDYAFRTLGMEQIFTMVDPDNLRSVNNITQNSGGVLVGQEDSKYAHLQGGGKERHLFHIYPQNFYKAVVSKQHHGFLMTQKVAPAAKATKQLALRR